MLNTTPNEGDSESADTKVLQKDIKQEFHQIVTDKLLLDARRDAIIDVFIEKCHRGVSGDFTSDITNSSWSHHKSKFSKDDVAFISELKAELVKDLRCAGFLKYEPSEDYLEAYDDDIVASHVDRRIEIWAASKDRSDDVVSSDRDDFLESAIRIGSHAAPSAYKELQSCKDSGAPTLLQSTEQRGLELLSSAVQDEQATATFACGGSIKLRVADDGVSTDEDGQLLSPPVVLRWDNVDKTITRRVELPQVPGQGNELEMLLKDSQPATFGLGGVDVLDESYRKASKLDNTEFATSFNPYDYGIVDTIAQILFPSVDNDSTGDLGLELRGVRAELYKLNIYSGPSGMFHPHVDTPRGDGQFGSLVVCLPSAHAGGELLVRHEGTTVQFDWSTANVSSNCIRWAAFYSDCEHEVLEVTSGHRLTLTYNLYIREHKGGVFGRTLTMSPEQLPLYGIVKDLLDQPGFLREGAVLGFFCSHEYAHAHGSPSVRVPRSLKGVDMAIYAVFRALGLQIQILPVMELGGRHHKLHFGGRHHKLHFGGREQEDLGGKQSLPKRLTKYRDYLDSPTSIDHLRLNYDVHYDSDGDPDNAGNREVTSLEDYKDVQTRLQSLLQRRKMRGFSTVVDPVIVGTKLHKMVVCDKGGSEDEFAVDIRNEEWPNESVPGVQWLNEANYTNAALTHVAYGNQAELSCQYSAAALLVIVPPSSERGPFPIHRTSKRRHSQEVPTAPGV